MMSTALKLKRLFLICAVLCWCGCDPAATFSPSGNTVKIGVIAPFSGPRQAKGAQGLAGMQSARKLQPLLQNGDRIELVAENDANDPVLAVEALRKLAEEEKVAAIITFSDSDPVLAMARAADVYEIPILAATATHPEITRQSRYVSQLCFDDNFQGTVAALFVRDELLIDTAAVFHKPDNAYSSYLAAKFENKFESIGGMITDRVALGPETADLPDAIKGVHANAPELLYLPLGAEDVLQISAEIRSRGWRPKLMGSDGLMSNLIAQHEDELELLEGLLATDFFVDGMALTPFGKKAGSDYGIGVSTFTALGTEGYAVLRDAMNRCSNPEDRQCVSDQIRKTSNFEGLAGSISIGSDGKARRPLFIKMLRGGRPEFVVKVY
jgi:branched-chain amino acid transport system substrate-binding protein